MIFLLANTVFLVSSLSYGWLAGDHLDKRAALWIAAALLATIGATVELPETWIMPAILLIDIALLFAIVRIALQSPRYWPIWFAGLHLAGVIFAVTAVVTNSPPDGIVRTLAGFWGIPALLAMVAGIFLDRRGAARESDQAQPST